MDSIVPIKESSSKWQYLALLLSLAFLGLLYMKYQSNKEQLELKEAKMRLKLKIKNDKKAQKMKDIDDQKNEKKRLRKERIRNTITNVQQSPEQPIRASQSSEHEKQKLKSMNQEIERVERVMQRTSSRGSAKRDHED